MLLGNFLLELLFVGQNVALPGCDCLFLTNPNFLCNLKMVEKKKRKKADVYFLSTSKLTGPASYPVFFMHHSNKHANEVGERGTRNHFHVFMVATLYGERAAKDNWSCLTGNREKPLKAASNMKLFSDRMSMYRIA